MYNRTVSSVILLLFIALVTTVMRATIALADPHADRCIDEFTKILHFCTDGKHEVWYYDFSSRDSKGSWVPSGPYKTSLTAQHALERDRELCQVVDRYFEHTDCQTEYGDLYCAACGKMDAGAVDATDPVVQGLLDNATDQMERLVDEEKSLALSIRSVETNGHSNQFASIGNAMREYGRLLQDAKQRG